MQRGQGKSEEVRRSGEAREGQGRPGEARRGQEMPGDARRGQGMKGGLLLLYSTPASVKIRPPIAGLKTTVLLCRAKPIPHDLGEPRFGVAAPRRIPGAGLNISRLEKLRNQTELVLR